MDIGYFEGLLTKDIESFGCSLWGIEIIGSSHNPLLRIYIDKEEGVTLEDCEKINKHVYQLLLDNEYFHENGSIEVSSPGVDRKFFKIEQYAKFVGEQLKVRFKEEDKFITKKGELLDVENKEIILCSGNEKNYIKFNDIERANLEFKEVT
jgi:ribosome maturation factor RimP